MTIKKINMKVVKQESVRVTAVPKKQYAMAILKLKEQGCKLNFFLRLCNNVSNQLILFLYEKSIGV